MIRTLFTLCLAVFSFSSFAQKADDLVNDKNFIELVSVNAKMHTLLAEKFSTEELNQISENIEKKKSETLEEKDQLTYLSDQFKFDRNEFEEYSNKVFRLLYTITIKYGTVSQEVYTEAASVILGKFEQAGDCGTAFALCSASVGATGALMLGGCLTGTAGFGSFFCLAAATVYTANGVAECRRKYCKK